MNLMDNLAKIKARIRALKEMTKGRGCTESEAAAAARKVSDLMGKYALSEHDLFMTASATRHKTRRSVVRDRLWSIVALCTNTHAVLDGNGAEPTMTFYGADPCPEIAGYLKDLLNTAIDGEIRRFKASNYYKRRRTLKTKRAAVAQFTDSLVNRLGCRLLDVFRAQISEPSRKLSREFADTQCTGLVISKVVRADASQPEARWAGRVAGDRVPISHGVDGSKSPLQIAS